LPSVTKLASFTVFSSGLPPNFKTKTHPPIYPLCPWRLKSSECLEAAPGVLGTAFFISDDGAIFVTAKHVVEDYMDDLQVLSVIHVDDPPTRFRALPVTALQVHHEFDVAIGRVDLPPDVALQRLKLCDGELAHGEEISIFGFSNTKVIERQPTQEGKHPGLQLAMDPKFYRGTIDALHPNGFGLARGPVYVHTAETLGGISGGPMLRLLDSCVYGITSSGSVLHGTATDIRIILDWPLMFLDGRTLRQLAQQ
jgi:hypothetical protein